VIFDRLGVVAGAVREIAEVFDTGQPQARELTTTLETAAGEIHVTGIGYRINEQVWGPTSGVPRLGEDSRAILRTLDWSDERIDSAIDRGLVKESQRARSISCPVKGKWAPSTPRNRNQLDGMRSTGIPGAAWASSGPR
jgi:hypothetical protein